MKKISPPQSSPNYFKKDSTPTTVHYGKNNCSSLDQPDAKWHFLQHQTLQQYTVFKVFCIYTGWTGFFMLPFQLEHHYLRNMLYIIQLFS